MIMTNCLNTFLKPLTKVIAVVLWVFSAAAVLAANSSLTPTHLLCQGLENPQGIDEAQPRLSWISVSSDPAKRGQVQTAYQILVADSESALSDDDGNLWDSGKVESDQSIHIAYAGAPLESHQTCFWKVRVWDGDGEVSGWSEPASWSMGFVAPDRWEPTWIGSGQDRTPLLRKEFSLPGEVKRAWVYSSALGIYELRLNGEKVGDDLFAPGWTDYRARVQYQRYDVTDLLQEGDNAIGAALAPGWFAGNIAWFGRNRYGSRLALAAELHVEFADGSTEVISSDGTWKAGSGPLTDSDILDGDHYDARLEVPGWDRSGYDDSDWAQVSVESTDRLLTAQIDPPVGVIREMKPKSVSEPSPGVFVYDLGQVITGVVRIQVEGDRGTKITLQHTEKLDADGMLDRSNLTVTNVKAEATNTYILKGEGVETFQPQFTFHGFRYISVEGLEEPPGLDEVTGVVVGTRVPVAGSLRTSEDDLNQLISNIVWTTHNVFLSIPMDCPQRAERLGWAGDMSVMAAAAPFLFDVSRFYAKWQVDIMDAQARKDGGEDEGLMPNVAPKFAPLRGGYGGGWGDVGVYLPYMTWKRYGDTDIIERSYEGMAKWLTFLERRSSDYIVSGNMARPGDWEHAGDNTNHSLVATAYFGFCASMMVEMAEAIGRSEDAAAYRELFEKIREAFTDQWVGDDGQVANGSQTSQVLALQMGLLPEDLREAAVGKLLENIESRDYHLSTGFLGTQWLLHVLSDHGHNDIAYRILEQRTYPSWLYMIEMGATTIWESWGSLNPDGTFAERRRSLTHMPFGSVADWMYQSIGGLVPDDDNPAFKHFYIRPRPGGSLSEAEMEFQSPHGKIATSWTLDDDNRFTLDVEVPVNTTATILLPTDDPDSVSESGGSVSASSGISVKGIVEGRAGYEVGSGRYSFTTRLNGSASAAD